MVLKLHFYSMSVFLFSTGKPATFNVSIKPTPTFPLDVYFLMDFSESMKDDLAAIRSVAYRLG